MLGSNPFVCNASVGGKILLKIVTWTFGKGSNNFAPKRSTFFLF